MIFNVRVLLVGCALTLAAEPSEAQFRREGPTFAISLDVPTGEFQDIASKGLGFSMRTPLGDPAKTWSGRYGLNLGYFTGKAPYRNVQMFGLGIDLVHSSGEHVYQYFGVLQSSAKYAIREENSSVTKLPSSSALGLTGGLGLKFKRGETNYYVEVGMSHLLTDPTSSVWFPIRFGVRL